MSKKLEDIDRACGEIADRMLAEMSNHRFSVEHAVKALTEAGIDTNINCLVVGSGIDPELVRAATEAKSRGLILIDIQKDFLRTDEEE